MTVPVGRAMLASQLAATNSTKIDQFPVNIGTHGMLMIFNDYAFQRPGSRPLLRLPRETVSTISQSKGAVLLPIPNALFDKYRVRLSQSDMMNIFMGETAASTAASFKNEGISALANALSPIAATAAALQAGNLSAPGMDDALFIAKRLFGDNYLLGPISQGLGATLNPKASLLFSGVDLKDYSFQWTLAPTEQAESELLRRIVRRLKENALPSYSAETIATRVLLKYPSTVDIFLLGVDPNHFVRFKTAMIESVNVNYTPNGLSVLKGGKPAAIELSINLQEMDIHTADDQIGVDTLDAIENI